MKTALHLTLLIHWLDSFMKAALHLTRLMHWMTHQQKLLFILIDWSVQLLIDESCSLSDPTHSLTDSLTKVAFHLTRLMRWTTHWWKSSDSTHALTDSLIKVAFHLTRLIRWTTHWWNLLFIWLYSLSISKLMKSALHFHSLAHSHALSPAHPLPSPPCITRSVILSHTLFKKKTVLFKPFFLCFSPRIRRYFFAFAPPNLPLPF